MISIIWANVANIRILQDSCISRHENGPLLAIYDGKAKTTGQMPTFKDRMDKIIECLWVGVPLGKSIYVLLIMSSDPENHLQAFARCILLIYLC